MPVARSVSATQLDGGGGGGGGAVVLLAPKAHTLDSRLAKPSMMNGHGEPRRKRPFMSFRLSKKSSKHKEGGNGREVSQNPGGGGGNAGVNSGDVDTNNTNANHHHLHQGSHTPTTISENGAESLDGGSDSSSASVKPKKKYLTRVSSFVSRVASKVQGGGVGGGSGGLGVVIGTNVVAGNATTRGRLERSKTISVSDLRTAKVEDCVEFVDGRVPGIMGIRNHGNTCFINAVIQCLCHTDVLAEYFVLDQYKHDLARCNKINSKKYGTRGEITEQLAVLLKALWTLRYIPDLSMNFKNTVDKYESLYRGSQQHDAAEFLMFVLDKVHEDLNTASKRKYKKIKNTYGRPDEIVAAETLANHLRCNSSFIQEIFQAQFRSSLKCPHCQKESNTFDPFVCVSIPIPQRQVQAIFVCVVYLNQQPKQVQLGMSIETTATIQDLRQQLAEDCGIPAGSLIITEVDGEGFHRTFADGSPVNVIGESDPLYAIELPPQARPREAVPFLITWVNVVLADPENIRFGGVYQSQVVRDVSYVDLQKLLLKEMTNMVTNDTLTSEQESGLFLIGVDDGGSCVICLDPALDVPLFHECVEQALALCDPVAGPPHIKLVLQWTNQTKEKYIVDDVDHVDEHFSVKELKENPQQCASVSLHQCLQLHTSAEKLGCGDAWHCPTCNRKQQVVKRLMLWSAPQILVIHLKRFRQGTLQSNSSKLSTTVKFPLSGFDISEHVASKPNNTHPNSPADSGMLGGVWSPWKRPKRSVMHPEENVYDLYAVCYHHGKDMQGGHYTAMCKNTADNRWYSFDDSKVEAASEDQVVSPDAYILFYQRRSDNTLMSCSEGGLPEHWAFRIPLSYLPPALALPASKENKVPAPPPAPFERGRSYGTLPVGVRGQRQSSTEREHASDTEAPLASHEESPLLKRRSTSTLLEKDDSPSEETPKCSLKIETVKVDVLTTQKEKEKDEDETMDCDTTIITTQDSDEEMAEVVRKTPANPTIITTNPTPPPTTNKTVLISRCQAMRDTDLPDGPMTNGALTNGHAGSPDEEEDVECDVPSVESREAEEVERRQEQTPEVRIHPATPEVLAAHQGHSDGQPKRSIITLTLRPRNPSESSCEARVVSRTPSLASTRSSSSASSNGAVVNGVDSPYQNGSLEDDPHSPVTPEIRITPLAKTVDSMGSSPVPPPVKVSTRCMNANKTASFVVINTPTASPRAPRPKTPVIAGYNGSPKPYSSKVTVKTRDPSVESQRSQRSVSSRKENGMSSKAPMTNGKGPSVAPSVNYCSPLKVTTSTTTGPRPHRPERGELRYPREARCDHRDERYERREERYGREDRYTREDRYEKRDDRYEKEERFEKRDDRYEKRDDRYEKGDRYEKREDNRFDKRMTTGMHDATTVTTGITGTTSRSGTLGKRAATMETLKRTMTHHSTGQGGAASTSGSYVMPGVSASTTSSTGTTKPSVSASTPTRETLTTPTTTSSGERGGTRGTERTIGGLGM
ncbi:ubiquitin carboxyl-terminal hydrolase 31-like isoform X1 [Eriocheir sinensis]|uniref:ubiquitin carboxyl-terminal hydrolase 31-like isoform X1 n=1 Tax=Eriocheir sinensis TaxID=95602 RepID=UPI0021C89133|nr:ubiquitin carboxyl-terminal hydrolase 31-like isoform X1 [Eriocheir sinensis]